MSNRVGILGMMALLVGCVSRGKTTIYADSGGPDFGEADAGQSDENGSGSVVLSTDAMMGHLGALMDIALANGGNRAAGTSGYAASADYVRTQLESAGYSVTQHEFNIVDDQWADTPVVQVADGEGFELEDDFFPLSYTGSGVVTAPVVPVNVMVPPGERDESESGCSASDFADFPAGSIALLQRGRCTFQVKSDNAVEAGAAAVLIFNEGQPGRQDVFGGALEESYENPVPVFALSYDAGLRLLDLEAGQPVTVEAQVNYEAIPTYNIMAETGGDPGRAVVIGSHLDSVGAGPGINDNGSGVALVLEMALQFAAEGIEPDNMVKFSFWGGEELGLLGSIDYVFGMDETERSGIMANLNFDMIASPNPARMIYDGSGSLGGEGGPPGSAEIEAIFEQWFQSEGLAFQETPFDGRSDYGPFIWTGIPAGGLFTGAEQRMTGSEAGTYGGEAGTPYDACYHEECDTIENLDVQMLGEMAAAAVDASLRLAFWEGDLRDGPSGPPPIAPQHIELPDRMPSSCGAHDPVWRR